MVARIRTTTADGVRYSYVPNRGESARARELAESREALAGEGANAGIAPAARVPTTEEVSVISRHVLPRQILPN